MKRSLERDWCRNHMESWCINWYISYFPLIFYLCIMNSFEEHSHHHQLFLTAFQCPIVVFGKISWWKVCIIVSVSTCMHIRLIKASFFHVLLFLNVCTFFFWFLFFVTFFLQYLLFLFCFYIYVIWTKMWN